MFRKIYYLPFVILFLVACRPSQPTAQVKTGLDRVDKYRTLFSGKRIGIITNHTAYNHSGQHIIDVFTALPDVQVTALFGPEHGIRGKQAAGKKVDDSLHENGNIPVYSLYGKIRQPTDAMLANVDVLVFDIQDIGARYYTYVYTMALAMESAARKGIPFVVLDRPNPINGNDVEGNLLEPEYATFVGLYPIPVRHGMTIGELAQMINSEKWLKDERQAELHVIPMQGWKRDMWYDQTGLQWRAPSPNMPDLHVATVYPGTCLFEGTNVSEGRGTYEPFRRIGAPWTTIEEFNYINKVLVMPGVRFGPIKFVPHSIPSMSPNPKLADRELFGVMVTVLDRSVFRPYLTGIALVKYFHDADPEKFEWKKSHFDRLCGTSKIREFIEQGSTLEEIRRWIDRDTESFKKMRVPYLLYQ